MNNTKKYVLPVIRKQENIGNTVKDLNKSFSDLNHFLNLEKENVDNINNFAQNIDVIYDRLSNACSFLEQNKNNFLNVSGEVAINKIKWLKPIILFHIEKFYDDSAIFSAEYVNDVLCKWMQANYPVKANNIVKPNYVDGQTAFIFYLKTLDKSELYKYSNERAVYCQTQDVNVTVNCSTTTTGKACIAACGCVDCATTTYCKKTKPLTCMFKDRGLNLKNINRYLKLNSNYKSEDSYESSVRNIKLIVKDCVWQIDKTISDTIVQQSLLEEAIINPPKGIVTFASETQINTLGSNNSEIYPF
jgi:hypothetical protein